MLQLSLFVDRQTMTTLGNPNGDHLYVLIDMNLQLMEGLRERPWLVTPGRSGAARAMLAMTAGSRLTTVQLVSEAA